MGKWMAGSTHQPEKLFSSPANRARQTAASLAQVLSNSAEIIVWQDLYPGSVEFTLENIRGLPEQLQHILIVGHNPIMEELGSTLAAGGNLQIRMPTAALVMLACDIVSWREASPKMGKLRGLITPKMLRPGD